jgi:hypothetical protein
LYIVLRCIDRIARTLLTRASEIVEEQHPGTGSCGQGSREAPDSARKGMSGRRRVVTETLGGKRFALDASVMRCVREGKKCVSVMMIAEKAFVLILRSTPLPPERVDLYRRAGARSAA